MPAATYDMQYRLAIETAWIARCEAKLIQYSQYVKNTTGHGGADRAKWLVLAEAIVNDGASATKAAIMAKMMASSTNIIQTIAEDYRGVHSTAPELDFSGQLEALYPLLAGVVAA